VVDEKIRTIKSVHFSFILVYVLCTADIISCFIHVAGTSSVLPGQPYSLIQWVSFCMLAGLSQ